MNEVAQLQHAFDQSRFKEVVVRTVEIFESRPLNDEEIIQLGELALKAIKRDLTTKYLSENVLKKMAQAYARSERYALAKSTYKKLYQINGVWSDYLKYVHALASTGEIEELQVEIERQTQKLIKNKAIINLKEIVNLLDELKVLNELRQRIAFEVACLEGDIEKVIENRKNQSLPYYLQRDANWESKKEWAEIIANEILDDLNFEKRIFIKKMYEMFLSNGPSASLLQIILKYYRKEKSPHIGYFLSQNPGVKVELPEESWIDKIFKDVANMPKPTEIDIEIDLGTDLFKNEIDHSSSLQKIKNLETRIAFLIKNAGLEEAKKFYKELKVLDQSNNKFDEVFEGDNVKKSIRNNYEESWSEAQKTLDEIMSKGNHSKQDDDLSVRFSIKNINNEKVASSYREYVYALIAGNRFDDAIEILDRAIALDSNHFKDATYLKARTYLALNRFVMARSMLESMLESCILEKHELAEVNYLLAQTYEQDGMGEIALKIYRNVNSIIPNYRLTKFKIESLENVQDK